MIDLGTFDRRLAIQIIFRCFASQSTKYIIIWIANKFRIVAEYNRRFWTPCIFNSNGIFNQFGNKKATYNTEWCNSVINYCLLQSAFWVSYRLVDVLNSMWVLLTSLSVKSQEISQICNFLCNQQDTFNNITSNTLKCQIISCEEIEPKEEKTVGNNH